MERELTDHLVKVTEAYCRATGLGVGTIARRMFGSDRFLTRLAEGATFTVRLYDEALDRFSANWPEGVAWPDDVPRPIASEEGHDCSPRSVPAG